jgi:quinate dehydrogenase (quinone)
VGSDAVDLLLCRIQFKEMRHQGVFTPPGEDRSLQFPGSLGGMNWGSVSVDPNNSLMFVNDMRLGLANYMVPRESGERRQRHRDGHCADGRHAVWRHARTFPVAAGHSVPETAVRHHVRGGSENRETGVAGAGGHRRRYRAAGDPHAYANPDRYADLGASLSTQSGLLFFAGTRISTCARLIPPTGKRSGNRVCRSAASPAR